MMDFKCAICHKWMWWKHLAFVIELDEMKEGVCGDCAEGEQ